MNTEQMHNILKPDAFSTAAIQSEYIFGIYPSASLSNYLKNFLEIGGNLQNHN